MGATKNNMCDIVTELISMGADVDIQDNVSNLFYSCYSHNGFCTEVKNYTLHYY